MLQVIGGNGGAPSIDSVVTSNAATNTLFGYANPTSPFPGWEQPSPNVYTFTLPPQGWWNTLFGGGVIKEVANWIADLVMQGIAWLMHLVILLAVDFSNPNWLVDPVAKRLGLSFSLAYQNVFLRLLPFLVLAVGVYLVWQFLRARHVKMLTAVVSTAFSGALLFIFFSHFSPIFQSVNNLSENVDNQVSAAIESISNLRASTIYDAAWNIYVLEPWEIAQFGHGSNNLQDFNVSSASVGESYTTDSGGTATIQSGDNWVTLFMQNTTTSARQSLLNDILKTPQPFAHTGWTSTDVKNSNPYNNIVFLAVMLLLGLPCLMFLAVMAFYLFGLEMAFLFMTFMGIFVLPLGFVPEVGWTYVLKWVKQAIGYLLLKLANVVYLSITFLLISIVMDTVSLTGDETTLVTGAIMAALIFLGALIFRGPIFSTFIMPTLERFKSGSSEASGEDEKKKQASKWTEFGDRTRELLSKRFDWRGHSSADGAAGMAGTLAGSWSTSHRGGAAGGSSAQGSADRSSSSGSRRSTGAFGKGPTSDGATMRGPTSGRSTDRASTGDGSAGNSSPPGSSASGDSAASSLGRAGADQPSSLGDVVQSGSGANVSGEQSPSGGPSNPSVSDSSPSDMGANPETDAHGEEDLNDRLSSSNTHGVAEDEQAEPHLEEAFERAAATVEAAQMVADRRTLAPKAEAEAVMPDLDASFATPPEVEAHGAVTQTSTVQLETVAAETTTSGDKAASTQVKTEKQPSSDASPREMSRSGWVKATTAPNVEESVNHPLEEAFAIPQPNNTDDAVAGNPPARSDASPEAEKSAEPTMSVAPTTLASSAEESGAHPLDEAFGVSQPRVEDRGVTREGQGEVHEEGASDSAKLEDEFQTPSAVSGTAAHSPSSTSFKRVNSSPGEPGNPKSSEAPKPNEAPKSAEAAKVVPMVSVSSPSRTVRLRAKPKAPPTTQRSERKSSGATRNAERRRVELGRRTPLDPNRTNRHDPKS